MAITIANRADLIRAVSALGFQVSAEQGVFDGLFAAGGAAPTSAEVSTALKAKTQVAALTAVAVADATDATTAAALANANKAAINAIIAALKA